MGLIEVRGRNATAGEWRRLGTVPTPVGPTHLPTAAMTPDHAVDEGQVVTIQTGTSACPFGGTITAWEFEMTAKPVGSTAVLAGSDGTRTFTADLPGNYDCRVRVTCSHTYVSEWHAGRTYTANDLPNNPDPPWQTLDLSNYDSSTTQPYEAPEAPGTLSQIVESGVRKVRVGINGSPEGSRCGGHYKYGKTKVGEMEEVYLAWKLKFHPGFLISSSTSTKGGGKIGPALSAQASGAPLSGGGKFYHGSSRLRHIIKRSGSSSTLMTVQTYHYVPRFTHWFEWEGARLIDGITGTLTYNTHHRFNHHQVGGNRAIVDPHESASNWRSGDPIYPGAATRALWQKIGDSRYSGFGWSTTGLTFAVNEEIEFQMRVKMNTFGASTFDGKDWMPGTWNKPNKDGIYELWVKTPGDPSPTKYLSTSACVFRYPNHPTLKWNTIEVGASAGGPFEGCDGTVDVYDVRWGAEPIIT